MSKDILYNKLKSAVIQGLAFLMEDEKEFFQYNISDYRDSIELNYADTGYPYFSNSSFSKRNYFNLFSKNDAGNKFSSWIDFRKTLLTDDQFCKYYFLGKYSENNNKEGKELWDEFYPLNCIIKTIERYVHLYGIREFIEEKFRDIFSEWYNVFHLEELSFDITIPILMASFDLEEFKINDQISLIRMSDLFQKSRNKQVSLNSSAHSSVVSSATHAFVIKNYSISNENSKSPNSLTNIMAFSVITPIVDKLFAYLRSRLNIESGYCQIISCPNNWAFSWKGELTPLEITSTKAYPDYFENFYWYNNPDVISKELLKAEEINKYLKPVQRNIQLAIDRLNNAVMRKHLDDSILDITIALEALFIGSKDNSEVTHKLSTRIAAFCKKYPFEEYTPYDVFKICKKIYEFRSAIIHSKEKKDVDKSKKLIINQSNDISTVEIGIKILAHSLNIVLLKEEDFKVEDIDKSLFE